MDASPLGIALRLPFAALIAIALVAGVAPPLLWPPPHPPPLGFAIAGPVAALIGVTGWSGPWTGRMPADDGIIAHRAYGRSGGARDRRSAVKKRLDVLLVERGLAESRAQAQALVMAGRVPGHSKPGEQVDEDAPLEVEAPPPYVSRAGHKLANALDAFGIDVDRRSTRSTSAPRPAGSPTCCCSAAPRA